MGTRTTLHHRVATGLLGGALLLVSATGCGDTADTADTTADATTSESAPAEETTTESAPPEDTGSTTETSGPQDTTEPQDTAGTAEPTATDGDTTAAVDCTGTSCSLTLSGDGAQAEVLGTQVALGAVENGRATVRVGDQELSCSQGERVSAGPVTVECTTVAQDSVTMTASLG
jgi:hypothetical protein